MGSRTLQSIPVALLALASLPAQALDCTEHTITRVRGTADPAQGLNILFMSDGFQAAEMDDYKCAVGLLVDSLLAEPPFSTYACNLNFYRADLPTTYDTEVRSCGSPAAPVWTGAGDPACAPHVGGPAGNNLDSGLNVKVCPAYLPVARIAWPDYTDAELAGGSPPEVPSAETRALDFARQCGENIHAAVIVADTPSPGAAALDNATPKLVVTTLAQMERSSRHHKLAHELGHTFGLLDEYTDANWESDDYHCGRNVWSRCEDCDNDQAPDPGNMPKDASWSRQCDANTAGLRVSACNGALVPSRCVLGLCNCSGCGDLPQVAPTVGFFEGGAYEPCGHYRSQLRCRMNFQTDRPFCRACRCLMQDFAQDGNLGFADCGTPPICPPVTEVVIRDCDADDGTIPSGCTPVDSPDIYITPHVDVGAAMWVDLDVTACATNVGNDLTSGDLSARFDVGYRWINGESITTVQRTVPIAQLTAPPGSPPPTGATWAPGEQRCLSAVAKLKIGEPGEIQLFGAHVTLDLAGDPPVTVQDVADDDNQSEKQVAF